MTSTGPLALTTTFTPPPACTTNTWLIEYISGVNYYTEVITGSNTSWWMSLGPTKTESCYPSGYQASTETYFSPGICPEGYWTAAQTVITIDDETETRGTCCPNNYAAQTELRLAWYTYNACTSFNANTDEVWTFTKAETLSSTTRSDGINAQGISIRWKAADFAVKTTTTASDTSTTSTTFTSRSYTTTPSATASATSEVTPSSNKGLSTGAKAGIVIGAAVGGLSLIILAILLWIRRRKKQGAAELDGNFQSNAGRYEMSSDTQRPAELGGLYAPRAELQSDQKYRAELNSSYEISELDGGQYPSPRPI